MSLFRVVVEAWDETGNGDYYEVLVLANTEKSARVTATRALTKKQLTGAHSVGIEWIDPYNVGVVAIKKKEVAHDQ